MESLPYDNLQELALLVQNVFLAKDKKIVDHAHSIFIKMARDPIRFTDSMYKIITDVESSPEYQRIKKGACISLEKVLAPFLQQENPATFEARKYVLEMVIQAIYSSNVNPTTKAMLKPLLKQLYLGDKKSGVFKTNTIEFAIKKLETNQINDYAASMLLMRSALEDPYSNQMTLAEWYRASYEGLLKVGATLVEEVGNEILNFSKGESNAEKASQIYFGAEVLKLWTRIIGEFIKKLGRNDPNDLTKPNYLDIVVDKEDLCTLLLKAMIIQIPMGTQIKECLISTSDFLELDQLLNTIKTGVLRCFEYIIDFKKDALLLSLSPEIPALNLEYNRFLFHMQGDGIKAILKSLFNLSRAGYKYIDGGLQDKAFHELIVQCLTIIRKLVAFKELYSLVAEYKSNIIIDICFPLIASTHEEQKNFEEDPQGYINMIQGIHEEEIESSNNNAKVEAIYLLQKLCSSVDGAGTAIINGVETLIEYSLNSNDVASIDESFPKLAEFKESAIIIGVNPDARVEACLVIIAGLYYDLDERGDLLYMIQAIFVKYHEFFLGSNTDAKIKAGVCLFFGHYSSIFFYGEHEPLFGLYLKFVIECVERKEEALVLRATDTLLEMMAQKDSLFRLVPFIAEILVKLASIIMTTESTSFFDAIKEIFMIYSPTLAKTPNIVGDFVTSLVERAKIEYEEIRKTQGAPKVILTKIWNIIKVIGEDKSFIPTYQEDIEKALVPLFSFLETDNSVVFDEDILSYLNSTMKLSNKVTPTIWTIFKLFRKIFEQRKRLITPLFQALNQIIVHGKDEIEADLEKKQVLLELGILGLNPTHSDSGQSAVPMAALHLQVLIQYVGIPDEYFAQMLVACYNKYIQLSQQEKPKVKQFVKVRLGGVFLLAFLRNFELTQAVLLEQNGLGTIMELFTQGAILFENHTYDRKVYLIGLCNFLMHPEANPIIVDKFPKMMDILIAYLRYVRYIDQKNAKQGKGRKGLSYDTDSDEEKKLSDKDVLEVLLDGVNEIPEILAIPQRAEEEEAEYEDEDDDDVDDEDDGEVYFPTERGEVNHYANNMTADIKNEDEFEAFRASINKLKEANQTILGKLIQGLDERKKNFLLEVVQSKRISIGNTGVTESRRIIKTAGRKIANIKKPE